MDVAHGAVGGIHIDYLATGVALVVLGAFFGKQENVHRMLGLGLILGGVALGAVAVAL